MTVPALRRAGSGALSRRGWGRRSALGVVGISTLRGGQVSALEVAGFSRRRLCPASPLQRPLLRSRTAFSVRRKAETSDVKRPDARGDALADMSVSSSGGRG
jgi:hypothetical protein